LEQKPEAYAPWQRGETQGRFAQASRVKNFMVTSRIAAIGNLLVEQA